MIQNTGCLEFLDPLCYFCLNIVRHPFLGKRKKESPTVQCTVSYVYFLGGVSDAWMHCHWQLGNTHYKINIICQFKGFLDMMAWCEGQMMVIGANTVQ